MRKFIAWLVVLCICPVLFAQNVRVMENTYQRVSITFTTDSLYAEDISRPEGVFTRIAMKGYGSSNNPGAPQLPQLSKLLQIPVCDSVVANIVNSEYTDYDAAVLGIHHPLFPVQPSVPGNVTNPPFVYDQAVYATDTFYALPLVSAEKAGIRRDIALANIYVSPVQYNPVTNRIRIYTRIDVQFTFANADLSATTQLQKYASPMFTLDDGIIANPMKSEAKNEINDLPITYLIIANSMFESNPDLAAFVQWKRRLGYRVTTVYVGSGGGGLSTTIPNTTNDIKSFIQNLFNSATSSAPAPTFLLLVGDVEQIPAFSHHLSPLDVISLDEVDLNHVTDLYFATLVGEDYLPDCYYGRLSAQNNTQLSNQLKKIMKYEQYTTLNPNYLGNAVLFAGMDSIFSPSCFDVQISYINSYYFKFRKLDSRALLNKFY